MSLASIIEAILKAICEAFALPLVEDGITGKLNTPHTATEAEADSGLHQEDVAVLADWDKAHP